MIEYIWLYQNWNGLMLNSINDPNNQQAITNTNTSITNDFKNNIYFNNTILYDIYNWTFGKKIAVRRTYTYNNVLYNLSNGVNLQVNSVSYNNNNNISKFFNCVTTFATLLQTIVANTNEKSLYYTEYITPLENLFENLLKFQNPVINKYVIQNDLSPSGFIKSTVSYGNPPNYKANITPLAALFSQPVIYDDPPIPIIDFAKVDRNEYVKLINLVNNILYVYTADDNTTLLINKGDYGIIYFDDQTDYYVSIFYCTDVDTTVTPNKFTIISIEINLTNIIIPSVQINGDLLIYGELNTNSGAKGENAPNYLTVDSYNNFLGVKSTNRKIFYDYVFNTSIPKTYVKNQNVYFYNDEYPNVVCERNWETDINDDDQTYANQFTTISSSTMKRSTDIYTFQELYDY